MKKSELILRRFVRLMMSEGPAGAGVTADPTTGTSGAARDYEIERGTDIYGFWYRSPGDKGSGDPGRPDDAEEYIGMTPPPEGGEETTTPKATASEGVKKRLRRL
jgi:hypothetical protein